MKSTAMPTGIGQQAPDFSDFVAANRPRWVRAAGKILGDMAEAEDVVQDALTGAWKLWNRQALSHPNTYMYRAVTLNAIKRRMRRRLSASVDPAQTPAPPQTPGPWLDPLELEQAIQRLPPPQQAVIRLRFYMGLTFTQIGRNLSMSSNTVASRCRYALANLRQSLKHMKGN
jgi:DNA-directed RNA polymerase specialized sigma24 family protein